MRRRPGSSTGGAAGYTLIELLIVLAILGLVSAWLLHGRNSRVPAAVVALRTQLLQARFEAIERNAPVAVVYSANEATFRVRLVGELGFEEGCRAGTELGTLRLADFPGVEVRQVPSKGLVWLPSGSGRTCSGSGAFNQTISLADSTREARVIVSRAGRVRSELDL